MTDRVVSHYRILELIGEGGMGVVYKAEDTRLKRTVALKFLSKDITGTGEHTERFLREAQAAAALDHPNICTVYEINEVDGETFLAMAFLEGQALDERIQRGPLPLETVYEIGKQAAEGLAAAHAAGVVHRDIKSSNIMISEDRNGRPVVKLMDFGLAQVTGASKLTKMDSRMGTTAYMSPEQTLGEEVGPPSDLWSLGVVIYEAVVAELPFKGHYDQAVLYGILNEDPMPLTSMRSRVPMELEWIVEKCLAKDPSDRYQDARDLVVDLEMLQRRTASGRTSIQRIDDSAEGSQEGRQAAPSHGSGSQVRPPANRVQSGSLTSGFAVLRRFRRLAPVAAIFAGLAIAFSAGSFFPAGDDAQVGQLRRFTLRPGDAVPSGQSIGGLAISPDGRNIAFSTTGSNGSMWLQPLDRHEPIQIEGTTGARDVFWSPDSAFIGFTTSRTIAKVALRGLAVTTLVDEGDFAFTQGTWTADGQSIVYSSGGGPPLRVSALGGVPRPLFTATTQRFGGGNSSDFSFIPVSDGRQVFVYSQRTREGFEVMARVVTEEEVGEPVRLVEGHSPTWAPSGYLLFQPESMTAALWAIEFLPEQLETRGEPFIVAQDGSDPSLSADGTLVYMDNPFAGERQLVWIDRNGELVGEIGKPQSWIVGPRLSPTGDRVLATGGTGRNFDLWVHESGRPVLSRLTFDDTDESGAVWAPDGQRVAFTQRGSPDLKLASVGGGNPGTTMFTFDGGPTSPLDWSRDGRYILYQRRLLQGSGRPPQAPPVESAQPLEKGRGRDINAPVQIGYLEQVGDSWEAHDFLPPAPFIVDDAVFSPNGRFVAYESNESGDFEVYVKPFPEGEQRWQITTDGGRLARWSRDGTELYFLREDTLYRVAVETRDEFRAGEAVPQFSRESLLRMRRFPTYDAGMPGRFVVVSQAGEQREIAIRIVLNWLEEFRTR